VQHQPAPPRLSKTAELARPQGANCCSQGGSKGRTCIGTWRRTPVPPPSSCAAPAHRDSMRCTEDLAQLPRSPKPPAASGFDITTTRQATPVASQVCFVDACRPTANLPQLPDRAVNHSTAPLHDSWRWLDHLRRRSALVPVAKGRTCRAAAAPSEHPAPTPMVSQTPERGESMAARATPR